MTSETEGGVGRDHNNPPLAERLPLEFELLIEKVADTLTEARGLPVEITSDAENSALGEIVKKLRAVATEVEASRKAENEPHLEAQRTINAFFAGLADRIQKGKSILEARGKKYLDGKAEKERIAREEAAKIAREEEERLRREAEIASEAGREVHAAIKTDQADAAARRVELATDAAAGSAADLARTRTASGVSTLKTGWKFEVENLKAIPLASLRPYLSQAEIERAIGKFVKAGGRELKGVRIFEETKAQYR